MGIQKGVPARRQRDGYANGSMELVVTVGKKRQGRDPASRTVGDKARGQSQEPEVAEGQSPGQGAELRQRARQGRGTSRGAPFHFDGKGVSCTTESDGL